MLRKRPVIHHDDQTYSVLAMLNQTRLNAGQRLTRPGPALTLQAFTDFGRLLGTDAPIHNDPAYAAKTQFGSVISPGAAAAGSL
jgi:acyl dehydratase